MSSAPSPDAPPARARLGLNARLALLFGAAFLVVFAAFAVGTHEVTRAALISLADRLLDGELRELEARLVFPASPGDGSPAAYERAIRNYARDEVEEESSFGLSYRVSRAGGETLIAEPAGAWSGIPPLARGATRHETVRAPGGPRRVVAESCQVAPLGRLDLEIGYDLGPAEAELDSIVRLILLGTPLALAVAGAGGYLLAGRALAPLREIEAAALRVSQRGKGERIPGSTRGDELDTLAATLNVMLERLDAAIESNARFTEDAAHELRTPLQALQAEVEVARRQPGLDPGAEAVLARIAERVGRLAALVRDLLTLARADHAHSAPRERVAVAPLLRELVEDLAPLGAERSVRLVGPAPTGVEVIGDRGSLRRLFGNLIENACLYADPGEARVDIALRDGTVEVSVEDDGPGLADEERARLFSRFWRSDVGRARNPGGTGLGLSIAAAIARAHGGAIAAAPSARGRGTRFSVVLATARG
jgi:signal transduction histidine kinase